MGSATELEDPTGVPATMNLKRSVYTLEDYHKTYDEPTKPTRSLTDRIRKVCTASNVIQTLLAYIPVVKVVKKYKPKTYITGDVLAGLTASFLHIPQGMAFGLLASLRPIYGLYLSFFPVLFYVIFGTSPYVSFGSNAILALLTKTVVEREADIFVAGFEESGNATSNQTFSGPSEADILQVKVGTAMACSLLSGIMLLLMGIFKLGFLTSYLSMSFIGGFTTAAAVHITSSQLPSMLGIKTNSYSGAGKLILFYIDLFRKIESIKVGDVSIAIICVAILLAVKIGINERYKEKMKMPIPIDLIIVVVSTLISYLARFEQKYDVNIVGTIPSGFKAPSVPKLDNFSNIISDAIVMGILSLTLTIALAKLMAKKHNIPIDDNQELVAYGAGNILSSFFGCFPSGTAPPRTMVLSSLGARTTLNGIPTVVVSLLIILVIGQLFESLPVAVLAAMVSVSIKDLTLQYRNLPNLWRINKYDFIIWVMTNAAGVLLDLDYGLIVGVGTSILLIVVQNQLAVGYIMKVALSEDVLYKKGRQRQVERMPGVTIFRFPASLFFATAERFKTQIYKEVLNPQLYLKMLKGLEKKNASEGEGYANKAFNNVGEGIVVEKPNTVVEPNHSQVEEITKPRTVIIDCSMVQYIDMVGTNTLQEVTKQYKDLEIKVLLTGITRKAEQVLTNAGFFKTFPKTNVFLEVFDALEDSPKSPQSVDTHL